MALRAVDDGRRRWEMPAHWRDGVVENDSFRVVMRVTPAIAAEMMSVNVPFNRPMSDHFRQLYVNQMREGYWVPEASDVRFDEDGRLIDGQTRLQAVIDAGVTVEMGVIFNVPGDAFGVIDRGRKRKIAEQLRQRGIASPLVVGAMVRWHIFLPERRVTRSMWADAGMSERATVEYVLERRAVFEQAATRTANLHFLSAPSMLAALYVLFAAKDAEAADAFFDRLADGAGLAEDDPVLVVRNAIVAKRTSGRIVARDYWLHADWIIKAWNAKRRRMRLSPKFTTMGKDKDGGYVVPEVV